MGAFLLHFWTEVESQASAFLCALFPNATRRCGCGGEPVIGSRTVMLLPAIALIILVVGLRRFVVIDWFLSPNFPPVWEPGSQWSEYREKITDSPLYRLIQTRKPAHNPLHHHNIELPIELIDLILDHLSSPPHNNKRELLNCALVCPCWLFRSRRRVFRTIQAQQQPAYDLMKLLRSPLCTIHPHIRVVELNDMTSWNTSNGVLAQMSRLDIPAQELRLRPLYHVSPPSPKSHFSKLISLSIHIHNESAFGGDLASLATFISSFHLLQTLKITTNQANFGAVNPLPPIHLSPYLRDFSITTSQVPHGTFSVYVPRLILQGNPRLENLKLLVPTHDYALEDYLVLNRFFQQARPHLMHVEIVASLYHALDHGPLNGLALMLPLEEDVVGPTFPRLQTLAVKCYQVHYTSPMGIESLDRWVHNVVRQAPLVKSLLLEGFKLSSKTDRSLVEDLTFKEGKDLYLTRWYQRDLDTDNDH